MTKEIIITNAIQLKPENKYLIVLDGTKVNQEDVIALAKKLGQMGIKNIVGFSTQGKPDDIIKIIEEQT